MPPNHQTHCTMYLTGMGIIQHIGNLLLLFMTFERCYSIIKPHKAASFNTVKRAKIIILCVVIFSCLYSIPSLFFSLSSGRLCFSFAKGIPSHLKKLYFWMRMFLNFLLPFVLLLTMNSFIIHTLQHRSSQFMSEGQGQGQTQGHTKVPERQIYII